jgi:arabinose-5-phosphate isomerase
MVTRPTHRIDAQRAIALAQETLSIEAQALQAMAGRVGDEFVQATQLLLACSGRVVVTGMGKSGHVGRKITAT